jgi:hypothetical protein
MIDISCSFCTTQAQIDILLKHSKLTLNGLGTKRLVKKNRVRSYINIAVEIMCSHAIHIKHKSRIKPDTNNTIPSNTTHNVNAVEYYTDGSFDLILRRAAFTVVQANNFNVHYSGRIPGQQNNYRAELFGILCALNNTHSAQTVTIYMDSLSSIDTIDTFNKTTHNEQRIK